jgi:hypothetical protein
MVLRAVQWLLLAILVGCVAGCRPRDPLEWRVEGRNGAQLQRWIDETVQRLPEPLNNEFVNAMLAIRDNTHGWSRPSPDSSMNPLCLRLRDRTVRDVMIEGHQLQIDARTSRIQNDLGQIARMFETFNVEAEEAARARIQRRILGLQQRVDREKAAVADIEKRIMELRHPAGGLRSGKRKSM